MASILGASKNGDLEILGMLICFLAGPQHLLRGQVDGFDDEAGAPHSLVRADKLLFRVATAAARKA